MLNKVIVIAAEKGGVGKSTIATQTSRELARRGYKVCAVDNEKQHNLTDTLLGDVKPEQLVKGNGTDKEATGNSLRLFSDDDVEPMQITDNLFLIGCTDSIESALDLSNLTLAMEFAESIDVLREDFDFVIIDTPPTYNILTTGPIMSSNGNGGIVIPTVLCSFSGPAVFKTVKRMSKYKSLYQDIKVLGIAPTSIRNPPTSIQTEHLMSIQEAFPGLLFDSMLYHYSAYPESSYMLMGLHEYKPNSPAAKGFMNWTDELLGRLGVAQ